MAIEADYMRYSLLRDLGRGTAFPLTADVPGGLQAGDRFYKSDASMQCVYTGSVWVTVHEYEQNLTPYFRNAQPYSGGATTLLIAPCRTTVGALVTGVKVYLDVLTTNNGTNYWSFAVKFAATTVYTFNTSADSAGAAINKENTPNTQVAAGGALSTLDITGKTGTPGSVVANATIWYRIIHT